MTSAVSPPRPPRSLLVGQHPISTYKICLSLGITAGALVSASVAQTAGDSPLRMGMASVSCALVGLVGARLLHLWLFRRLATSGRWWLASDNSASDGASFFGAVGAIALWSWFLCTWLQVPLASFGDRMIGGLIVAAIGMRLGCVCHGCCGGLPTSRWYGLTMHDLSGRRERRIPVPWLEIAWWLLAALVLIAVLPLALAPGSSALSVLAWYGLGRFLLEPLRQKPDLLAGRIRIHQLLAAVLALLAVAGLVVLNASAIPFLSHWIASWPARITP